MACGYLYNKIKSILHIGQIQFMWPTMPHKATCFPIKLTSSPFTSSHDILTWTPCAPNVLVPLASSWWLWQVRISCVGGCMLTRVGRQGRDQRDYFRRQVAKGRAKRRSKDKINTRIRTSRWPLCRVRWVIGTRSKGKEKSCRWRWCVECMEYLIK